MELERGVKLVLKFASDVKCDYREMTAFFSEVAFDADVSVEVID